MDLQSEYLPVIGRCKHCGTEFDLGPEPPPPAPGMTNYVQCPGCKRWRGRDRFKAWTQSYRADQQRKAIHAAAKDRAARRAEILKRRNERKRLAEAKAREEDARQRRLLEAERTTLEQLGKSLPDAEPTAEERGAERLPPVYCVNCEHACSAKAETCPSCGHPLAEPKTSLVTIRGTPRWALITLVLGVIAAVPAAISIWPNAFFPQSPQRAQLCQILEQRGFTFYTSQRYADVDVDLYELPISSQVRLLAEIQTKLPNGAVVELQLKILGTRELAADDLVRSAFRDQLSEIAAKLVPRAESAIKDAVKRKVPSQDGFAMSGSATTGNGWRVVAESRLKAYGFEYEIPLDSLLLEFPE